MIAATALLAAAAASGATWMATRPAPTASVVARAVYELPGGAVRRTIQRPQVAISPDGRYVASLLGSGVGAASASVTLRRLDQLAWTPVAGSEGATGVFFSPDSQWLGFWTAREIRRVAVSGGAPQTVYTLPVAQGNGPDGVSWGEDGNIYFVELGSRIMAVPAAGGVPVTVVDPPQTGATRVVGVETVPGSRALIYVVASAVTATSSLVLHRPDEGPDVEIGQGHTPRALPNGRLLFARGNSLFAAPLDLTAGRLTIEAQLVAQDVAVLTPVAQYGVSDTGTLIYIPGQVASEAISSLHRVARDGRAAELPVGKREYSDLRLSPDARRLAAHLSDQQNDVWVVDLARGTETRLTFAPLEDETPAWSPDGQWIAYSGWCGTADGLRCVYKRHADGSGDAVTLWQGSAHTHVTDWSPDGKWLVLEVLHVERLGDIYLLDAAAGDLQPYLVTGFAEQAGRVSPDGRWMAYQSAESGALEIYLQSFPSPGHKLRVSIDGGVQPVWSRDGRELYFRSATHLMAAALSAGPTVAVERPIGLFRDTFLRPQGDAHTGYDVFPDGSFVFVDVLRNRTPGELPPSLVAVFNWFEELSNALGRTR